MKYALSWEEIFIEYFAVSIKEILWFCLMHSKRRRRERLGSILMSLNGYERNISMRRTNKNERMKKARTFDELLDAKYGTVGARKRDEFEIKSRYFVISELLKEARKEAHLTQEALATKVGTKKSYISRLENGRCDIQLSTLYRIFEDGLGRRVNVTIG
jgi:DNA-binding XRE family transcriptional regulator